MQIWGIKKMIPLNIQRKVLNEINYEKNKDLFGTQRTKRKLKCLIH